MDRVNLISIITPVAAGRHHYLPQAYESLLAQTLPAGWEWEWIVQEDGDTGVLSALPDDRRIRAGAGRAGRAAMARTLGLARARGVLTRTLDADDELTPGALYRDITTLIDNPDISWCVSPAVDLHPDGTETSGPCDPPAGPLAPGTAAEGYRNNQLPIVGGTVTAYTELVRLLGGWPALPASEDVALLLALEAVSRGWMVGTTSLRYRKWPGQSTAEQTFRDADEVEDRRATLLTRVQAFRRAGWSWSPSLLAEPLTMPA